MSERIKNLIKKTVGKDYKKLALLIALIIAAAGGLYFFNELLTLKSEKCSGDLNDPYVLIEKNYEIYELGYPGGPYQYFIFDNEHKLLDHGTTNGEPPKITITHGLIKTYVKFGADGFVYQYYEPEKGLDSEPFFVNIINESDTMVVYIDRHDKRHLVVQEIFDESKYYRTFERDFSDVDNPVTQADFINDGMQLRITYKSGKDEHEVTESIDLYSAAD